MLAADSDYYTWVDEQGRIHNSPKPPGADSTAASDAAVKSNASEYELLGINPDDFPDEAEVLKRQQEQREQNPRFYIWVDERGITHRQMLLDDDIKGQAKASEVAFDHIMAPPFRLQDSEINCCSRYRFAFKTLLSFEDAEVFGGYAHAQPIEVSGHPYRGWFVSLAKAESNVRELELLQMGAGLPSHRSSRLALLLLDEHFNALYWLPRVEGVYFAADWANNARFETRIQVRDRQVEHAIIMVPESALALISSTRLSWSYGTSSD